MKVLITGSQGFVGRYFVKRYLEEGARLTLIDIANGGIDARDFFRTNNEHFDRVIHLAAIVGGRRMIEGSPLSLAVDLSIDAEMFGWAMRTQPGCITYFSSSAAYPEKLQTFEVAQYALKESDIDLNNIMTPDFTYGWAKLTGEMLASYARKGGLTVHVYRPFSGYGTNQALDYPFPSFIDRAKRRADPFEIWGDGQQVRDFIHIDDIVEATFAGCKAGIETSNLCSGVGHSFNDLASIVCQIAGYKPTLKHLPAEPTGVFYRVGDPNHQSSFYTPQITLEAGIERAFAGL
jgi:nucleoside-diphosphate-sugar epimerase